MSRDVELHFSNPTNLERHNTFFIRQAQEEYIVVDNV
jgi:hypothetical protein